MSSLTVSRRALALFTAIGLICVSNVARPSPLIAFTDISANTSTSIGLNDTDFNLAVSWTQTSASSNVSLSAILSSNVGATSGSWYVTTLIGPGTTANDVVYSGTYSLDLVPASQQLDFNTAPRTALGTNLSFGAGTYYLVLDGPGSNPSNNVDWIGDQNQNISTTLAAGYTIGGYSSTTGIVPTDIFAPASSFQAVNDARFVFELAGVSQSVPEPSTLALLGLAVAGFGVSRRKKAGDNNAY